MGEIHAHEFMTIDGVIESPSWTFEFGFDPAMGEAIGALTGRAGGILLGRKTFEMFAPAWRDRTPEEDPGVPFFNDTTKHVVTATLDDAGIWQNSQVLGPYDPEVIRRLKDEGDLYVSGSTQLVRALIDDGLLDGLHLFVFPLALGAGQRMFPEGEPTRKLALAHHAVYPNGVVYLQYAPAC